MRWLTNFYDFKLKWTATAGIGIHPTKAWLSQLVNFKNAIWTSGHFRRTICNKILFLNWKKRHRNVWNASDCCWGFKGVQWEIPSEEASTLQIGSVAFPPGQCTSTQLHPCHRLFDQDGHQDSSSPSLYSRPCSLWLLVIP